MPKNFTISTLKTINRNNIIEYIYLKREATAQMIEEDLELSRPTVAQVLKKAHESNLIYQHGYAESTGGRKAKKYIFNNMGRISIGVEILIERYKIIAIDLYKNIIKFEQIFRPFSHTDAYYDNICKTINNFIDSLQASEENILGVGIALQGLISSDGKEVIYGKILNCTGLTIDEFTSRIPYPCDFQHDAEALANEALWLEPNISNAIFFNIRDNFSGAVIIDGKFFRSGRLKSGVFEHMTLFPGGNQCYCGKKGCINTYCSVNALLNSGESADVFFEKLRNGEPKSTKRWTDYLENLALAIDNLHMFLNSDVILGGTLAKYLNKDDLTILHEMIYKRSAFPSDIKYIKISLFEDMSICTGAAIPYIKKYLTIL